MKIAICGSFSFAKEILDIKKKLEKLGHKVVVPHGLEPYASGEYDVEDKWKKIEFDVIRAYFEEIKNSDAVLIANKTKGVHKDYIGGNSLMEMAFAHVLGKKIFLLNDVPDLSYRDEIEAMTHTVINEDLSLIK